MTRGNNSLLIILLILLYTMLQTQGNSIIYYVDESTFAINTEIKLVILFF